MNNITGIKIPTILIPGQQVDLSKWSVIACDQYTSQPEYWDEVERTVGESFSTYNMVLPEAYLGYEGVEKRIEKIYNTMKGYMERNTIIPQKPGFIYVERQTTYRESRKGLIIAIDLEQYDYSQGSQSLIRATEGTVMERIPPRMKIREKACIEIPHVMLLIDDPYRTVIEPLSKKVDKLNKLYDFELMMGGGHVRGYKVDDDETLSSIMNAFERLADKSVFSQKYNAGDDKEVLLFAVGDGNHSLAAAKAYWENLKKKLPEAESRSHPARYALVEVINTHDEGLRFEPIHRVVFNADPEMLMDEMISFLNKDGCDARRISRCGAGDGRRNAGCHSFSYITSKGTGTILIENPKYSLVTQSLQLFLDYYLKENKKARVDYIHGSHAVEILGSREGNVGFYLPSMDKSSLFKTIIMDGALPRKSFSVGEPDEKRYYLECRAIG